LLLLAVGWLLTSSSSRSVVGGLLSFPSVTWREELSWSSSLDWIRDGRVEGTSWTVGVDVGCLSCRVLTPFRVVGGGGRRRRGLREVVVLRERRKGGVDRLRRVIPLRLTLRA